jgi:glycosyltransferase involved in cell wall biosynthesis
LSQIPLLIMSDAVTSSTGLGRVTRDLAGRIHEHLSEVFEVAVFGYGGTNSYTIPYKQFPVRRIDNWVLPELPWVWNDFSQGRQGILLAIWNPGWLPWLADPSTLPPCGLRTFLESKPFEKWIYAPIDAEGWEGGLPEKVTEILGGFDRILHYSDWSATIDGDDRRRDWLPHGIDTSVFYPRNPRAVRQNFIESVSGRHAKPISDDVKIIGIIATNSGRKDWGLGFEACARLREQGHNIGIWAHTDLFQKHWDLVQMANEFGLANRVIFTNGFLSDETMAMAYSGCDLTFAIGAGEGFGFPIAESLACGTPVIHGNYGGGADMVPTPCLVAPRAWKWDGGMYINRRPVYSAFEWAEIAAEVLKVEKSGDSLLDLDFSWDELWPKWQAWLEEGVNG